MFLHVGRFDVGLPRVRGHGFPALLAKGTCSAAQLLGRKYLSNLSFSLSSDIFRLFTIFASESATASPVFTPSSRSWSSSSRRSSSEPAADNVSLISDLAVQVSFCVAQCLRREFCAHRFLAFLKGLVI